MLHAQKNLKICELRCEITDNTVKIVSSLTRLKKETKANLRDIVIEMS